MYRDLLGQIPADAYVREDVLAAEIAQVFRPSWLCVGFTEDLKNHQDFITSQIGPHSIVVQNFDGELRAFRNVCSHRFARIQTEASGNRPLQCPYHGWTYNGEGHPVGVPLNKPCFNLTDADKAELALEVYALEVVGHFVFVRMEPVGPDLKTFLGDYHEELQHLSAVCTDRFETVSYEWEANWKLGMDNAAEGYHVPLVHADSFGLILSLQLEISSVPDHSRYTGKLKDRSLKWWHNVHKNLKITPSDRYPEYGNFLIFPNIVITFSGGAFLTFQTFDPIAPQRLRINSTSWLATNRGGQTRDLVVGELKTFSAQVRDEDAEICRVTQAGMRDVPDNRAPLLGQMEGRIAHFQKAWAKRMGAWSVSGASA
ncbi:aromatic ring-hydroxylating oxygenase subunit alpha [Asticcacaulis sp. W401b]|uniref:aromatic ring-hydroxylating oxygenase subunit alpha n=1 Tax=Asticcacaulis sp. W401b TaxID=3388666 RepID=UPI0039710C14